MVNIIYQDQTVRFTSFDSNTTYNLADLRFFIPTDYNLLALYCVIKNTKDIDSVELISTTSDSKNYNCYTFSNEQPLSLESGLLTLFLFGVNKDKTSIISNEFDINLKVENFNTTSQLYVISKFGDTVANNYNKSVEIFKETVNLYSDILESIKKGGGSV